MPLWHEATLELAGLLRLCYVKGVLPLLVCLLLALLSSAVHFPGSPTFMAIVLTYDVDKSHTSIKQLLMSAPYNYKDTMRGSANDKAVECDLPNTTLYHPTRTTVQGKADIDAAAAQFGAKVEKTVTFELATPLQWRGKVSRYV